MSKPHPYDDFRMFFQFEHMTGEMRAATEPLCKAAHALMDKEEPSRELVAGLRKLLEAKDCVVRVHLMKPEEPEPDSDVGA